MSPPPRVSFVTALRDCLPLTQAMYASLRQGVDLADKEIVLIDDGSTDGTADWLTGIEGEPGLRILRNPSNLGFAAANNRAARAAGGETLVFLNNDLELAKGWLEPMLALLREQPQAGAVGNIQRNFATGLIDHAGIFFNLEGMPTHAQKHRRRPPPGPWSERNAATAACLATPRELFLSLGGFDEAYRNGFEDVDYCMRLKQQGWRIYVSHRSVVRHHISSSPGRHDRNQANSARFRALWSEYARPLGQAEWPREYFRRYARYWWRINPGLGAKALFLLCASQLNRNAF